ncbi:GCN5-related N-acetyltransferase [Serinicoccus hydrothermalis]|uniref:GCN5-related N-acetyltransferase n=1 Tax=Serinicoccus hydrothermalis TaxID=1758689 RepID=A0A1B1NAP3_9MICO|nr:GNAT family N-acetyltransferase [Serinicoccus hydrothermalis]ANS78474.1 GCN5-related N-acetyltransferase [Serinicoccus hydrothermalis]
MSWSAPERVTVRDAEARDAAGCAAIYAPYVRETALTFETDPPDGAELARRIAAAQQRHAWLVAERDGSLLGYAYAGSYRPRRAYARTAETSVYLAHGLGGQGIGAHLYRALLDRLRELGYGTAVAGLTPPNPGSAALHRSLGFAQVGSFTRVGRKFGRWHGCDWWELALAEEVAEP